MWPNPRIPFQMSSERARLEPLGGKPLMVNAVVNIEYWPFDRPMPRGVLPPPHGAQIEPPDLPNYSWVEYGMRCGMPRLFDMLGQRGIKASAFINAQCADVYPSLTKATVDAGWELVGHGWFQRSLKQVDADSDELRTVTKEQMVVWTAEGEGKREDPGGDREIDVEVIDVYGNIASVVVRSSVYREYLHLVRSDDGWRIANALWHFT